MNIKHTIIGVVALFALIGIGTAVWLYFAAPSGMPGGSATTTPVTLPGSSDVPGSGGSTGNGDSGGTASTVSLPARGGGAIMANDFINNGVTKPDLANAGRYLLAGDLGYCVTDPSACQAAPSSDFNIIFDSAAQSFVIGLRAEPLGAVRDAAEQFLEATLGISPADLCRLNYYVGTTAYVNETYASKNLGFRPCPGAVTLP